MYSIVLDLIAIVPTRDLIKVIRHHRGTRIRIQKCHLSSKTRGERPDHRPSAQQGAPPSLLLAGYPAAKIVIFESKMKIPPQFTSLLRAIVGTPAGPETPATLVYLLNLCATQLTSRSGPSGARSGHGAASRIVQPVVRAWRPGPATPRR